MNEINFPHCNYAGGLSSIPTSMSESKLHFTDTAVGMGMFAPLRPAIAVKDIASIEVEAGEVPKSRVANLILVGPLALLGKSSKPGTLVIVHTRSDGSAHFVIYNEPSVRVTATVGAWCSRLGIRLGDVAAQPASGSAVSLADEMGKLAQLHASGVLTADEFAAAKAQLLG